MILVTGDLNGFIGSNVTEALLNRGEDCVVTRHNDADIPGFLEEYVGNRLVTEQADATSISDLERIGKNYDIDSVVNAGGGFTDNRTEALDLIEGYIPMLKAVLGISTKLNVE